ncbi:MAG: hypothetical protein ACK5CA_15295 [Cyanobacteriota bacterium]|jgi:hypothetical protein
MTLEKIIQAIQGTPVPIMLIVVGLFVIVLAFVTKIGGAIEVSPEQRRWAVPVGLFLLVLGLVLNFSQVPPPGSDGTDPKPEVPAHAFLEQSERDYWDELHRVALSWDDTTAKRNLAELEKSKDRCVAEFAKRFNNELNSKGAEGFRSINPIKCSINKELNCQLQITKFDFSPQCS